MRLCPQIYKTLICKAAMQKLHGFDLRVFTGWHLPENKLHQTKKTE
jgi:hypothetical protein